MLKKFLLAFLLLGVCLPAARPQTAPAPGSASEPASSGGILVIDRLLQRLAVHKRMLVIGAHPDDEDNRLLTLVSRKMGAEVAYLSLSRGEGGQNLLGPHLGVPLGLIRTQELLAARRIDGGRQYFTRAYDFGFTRSLDETLSLWPKEVLLEDVTRIIRRFRPQVVVTVFSGTTRDGHGQHQASGVVGKEAAAADPAAFPDLEKEGLLPWKISALFCCGYQGPDVATIVLPTGAIDPLSGRSYHQIAMASRSNHRSQDMGALQPPGPNEARLAWVSGGVGKNARDPFDGVDTRLTAIAAGISDPTRRAGVEEHLRRAEATVGEARSQLGPAALDQTARSLATALKELREARGLVAPDHDSGETASAAFLDEKITLAETALAAATQVTVDAVTDRDTVAPGDSLDVKIIVWNAGTDPARVEGVEVASPDGWNVAAAPVEPKDLAAGTLAEWTRKVSPAGAVPTIPYFLRRP
ncbi:MAG TPA: PIG-L family deacetylase, partial [Thermoanaerobaculia bacterium]|nr:PIG-L family deacetylase [Thermoanaerobaculia bacterium]